MATACCFCIIWAIPESTVGIVTTLGAYKKSLQPGGPYCINPIFEAVPFLANLRQQQLPVTIRTKVDRAEVELKIQVQFRIMNTSDGIYASQFKLKDFRRQITAYVQDVLRSSVSNISVEQVFASKDEIGKDVYTHLSQLMAEFGYEILQTLLVEINPTGAVKRSFDMNNLNRYQKEADNYRQMLKTSEKNARSDAAKKRDEVLGQGISLQRQEIVNGLKNSVDAFTQEVGGVSSRDVLELILITQYFDMLKEIGEKQGTKIIFTPGNETGADQLRDAILQGHNS